MAFGSRKNRADRFETNETPAVEQDVVASNEVPQAEFTYEAPQSVEVVDEPVVEPEVSSEVEMTAAEAEAPKETKVRKPWTQEQKDAQAARMRAHWAANPHPLKGTKLSDERKTAQRETMAAKLAEPVLDECLRCGGPLRDAEAAKLRLGSECLTNALASGEAFYNEDGSLNTDNVVKVSRKKETAEVAPEAVVEQNEEVNA